MLTGIKQCDQNALLKFKFFSVECTSSVDKLSAKNICFFVVYVTYKKLSPKRAKQRASVCFARKRILLAMKRYSDTSQISPIMRFKLFQFIMRNCSCFSFSLKSVNEQSVKILIRGNFIYKSSGLEPSSAKKVRHKTASLLLRSAFIGSFFTNQFNELFFKV